MSEIGQNLAKVRLRINDAAHHVKRSPESIKLVAVSKKQPITAISQAYAAGQRSFGENYAQELGSKAKELSALNIEWHMIGNLQRNKAKLVTPAASWIETVDSIQLAKTLNSRSLIPLNILLQINIANEQSKSGINENQALEMAQAISQFPHLKLQGLMCIPPYNSDPEKSRPYFRKLKTLQTELNNKLSNPITELSMGMSHDFEIAIEEGATIVRVGSAIFGQRSQ